MQYYNFSSFRQLNIFFVLFGRIIFYFLKQPMDRHRFDSNEEQSRSELREAKQIAGQLISTLVLHLCLSYVILKLNNNGLEFTYR